jgi:hypothetical protein
MADLYSRIREENIKKYGTEFKKVLKIIINQYSDRTHFIYEILQNAEDAGATHIRFHLQKNCLEIFHNGRFFNEKDIQGVCGIADGTKEDGTRIGHFGIGFKSVYCYTEQPKIISGQYSFIIKDQLFPEHVNFMPGLDMRETYMVLPFNKEDVPADIAFKEIKDALIRQLNANSILMLANISNVTIEVDGYPESIDISKERYPLDKGQYADNVFSLSLRTTKRNCAARKEKRIDSDYLFFTDAENEATAIIFNVDGKELKPVRNAMIYAFFPTAKEAHQNFYIHAPFDTTPARDNFKEGSEYGKHNVMLIQRVGKLIWFSFLWMKNHGYLSVNGFNTAFPIYEYEEHDILRGIYDNSIDIISEEEILPTNVRGEFKRINQIRIPLSGVIVDVFDDADLRRLEHNHEISWLAKEFTTESFSNIRHFLDKNFHPPILDWKDLVMKMDAIFLKQKDVSWMEHLMSRISTYCIRRPGNDSHFIDVSHIPLVRTSDREQICARNEKGKLQVFLNNPKIAKFKIDDTFLVNNTIKYFYQNVLSIPEYNVEQEAVENVLPKYYSQNVRFKTQNHIQENIDDLKIIKDAITINPKILEVVKDRYIVTDGSDWYKPSDIYIKSNDIRAGYNLVKGIVTIRYLADDYFEGQYADLKINEEFFRTIGCSKGIRNYEVSKEDYLNLVKKYCGSKVEQDLRWNIFEKKYISNKMQWSFNYKGFPDLFENITFKKSLNVARFLNPNVMNFDIRGELVGADDQHFSGKSVENRMVYSALGLQLCYEKWIYIKGDEEPHCPLEVEKDDLRPEYEASRRLIDKLPFKEIKNALTDWLDKNIKDETSRDTIKNLILNHPEQLEQFAKATAKREANEEAKKARKRKSLKELLEYGDKEQAEIKDTGNSLEISPISEKARKKREKNLDKELAESLDHFVSVAKGLTFTSHTSNKEEREFLKQEYGGVCQICLKQINKYNGEHYFEAINIIKFNELPERLQNSSYLGWNSLCLCPNCAAEYNYCSKKISSFYYQVMAKVVVPGSEATIDIEIEMPLGKIRHIHYSPRHFMAMQEAFKIFADEQ